MESTENDIKIDYFDKKLGLITNNQVIIYKKDQHEKIDLQSVNNVKLVKQRVFYFNLLLVVGSCISFYLTYHFYHKQSVVASVLFILGASTLLYSFYVKFYNYTMIIKEKNEKVHKLRASQADRNNIKEFYFKISKRTRKRSS
ncbi:hypothetical protein [Flavobacterium sp.]|uniref:hypothetical protein n=1 Tax=Flavobacterium sp. TaxID=239 RepID=UPI002B4AD587|nr:hypothetical protein [Flavobacterium sp.]HLP63897.1 hypothetical protein [Flavobacterium sp.]